MAVQQGNALQQDIADMQELAPVFLFAVEGTISGGCSGGSAGWECEVKATENT